MEQNIIRLYHDVYYYQLIMSVWKIKIKTDKNASCRTCDSVQGLRNKLQFMSHEYVYYYNYYYYIAHARISLMHNIACNFRVLEQCLIFLTWLGEDLQCNIVTLRRVQRHNNNNIMILCLSTTSLFSCRNESAATRKNRFIYCFTLFRIIIIIVQLCWHIQHCSGVGHRTQRRFLNN